MRRRGSERLQRRASGGSLGSEGDLRAAEQRELGLIRRTEALVGVEKTELRRTEALARAERIALGAARRGTAELLAAERSELGRTEELLADEKQELGLLGLQRQGEQRSHRDSLAAELGGVESTPSTRRTSAALREQMLLEEERAELRQIEAEAQRRDSALADEVRREDGLLAMLAPKKPGPLSACVENLKATLDGHVTPHRFSAGPNVHPVWGGAA